ncbi:BTB domain-containing protein [Mycena sanguinolenta]|uniref:BTB domain-containing protein n=1 Tax=Mycena sanguinolenta TaxID=230812 RepID=A0A8H7DEU6_9AGAR|nr:BTB domain-containing protein [Mycena sanguinolenta]
MSLRPASQRTSVPITRSELWISDGSVVLQAESTQFRVHFGVLARHSTVFRTMQGLPQPPGEPTVDGCPVLQLADDLTDVEYLLKALYDPTFLSQKALPLPAVGALIRLGRKYEFKNLLNLAVSRLTTEYPTTLEALDALSPELQTITGYPGVNFDVIVLASENDILSVLPSAYYYCSIGLGSPGVLFEGIENADGTTSALPPQGYTLGWVLDSAMVAGCTDPFKCRQAREMFARLCLDNAHLLAFLGTSSLSEWCQLCVVCHQYAKEAMNAGRIKMWAELPQLFDLSPWSELVNDL